MAPTLKRLRTAVKWLVLLVIGEILPVIGIVFAYWSRGQNHSLRQILGYSTLTLVAISILTAIIIDVILMKAYRFMGELEFMGLLGFVAALPLVFGQMVNRDIDLRDPDLRIANAQATPIDGQNGGEDETLSAQIWKMELAVVLVVLLFTAYAKARLLEHEFVGASHAKPRDRKSD